MSNQSPATRACAVSLCVLALVSARGARADDAPVPSESPAALQSPTAIPEPTPAPAGAAVAPVGRAPHRWGLQVDGGVPDAEALNVLYRPYKNLRFSGGMLYNLASYGVRGGVTVLPYFPIAPSLSLEAGYMFRGDAYAAISKFTHVDSQAEPLLRSIGYGFVSAQVGLEIGHQDWFVFFVRGGISQIWTSVSNSNQYVGSIKPGSDGTHATSMANPSFNARVPDVKVGLMFFFL
jgi:hypothetical protein